MNRASVIGAGLLLLASCNTGLSRDAAIKAALRHQSSSTAVTVLSAQTGPMGRFVDSGTLPDQPRERAVWAVALSGTFQVGCGPAPPPGQQPHCPEPATSELIVLDYASGEFIVGQIPAP